MMGGNQKNVIVSVPNPHEEPSPQQVEKRGNPGGGQVRSDSLIEIAGNRRLSVMNFKVTGGQFCGALIVALSVWLLQSFLLPLLVACVTAIASWPLYRRFRARLPKRIPGGATSLIFTSTITVFVLAPLMFAVGALLTETHALLLDIAAADRKGIAVPTWVANLPLAGSWLAARWQSQLAHPEALSLWMQGTDVTILLSWTQSLGQFLARHVFIIGFTILILFFLYQAGESLAEELRQALRHAVGERAEGYVDLATCALRATVNSLLILGLFDGCATGLIYAIVGVAHAAVWAAITGLLALIPFLGYVAVTALSLKLAIAGAALPALVSFSLGSFVLLCGDKIVRPVVAREGTNLPFVWVLMGCLGGFEVLGLVGVVIGPVLLALARELWEQHVRELALLEVDSSQTADRGT